MTLFKLSNKISPSWFSVMHKSIGETLVLSELFGFMKAIEAEMNNPYTSTSDKIQLLMLKGYCVYRIKLINKALRKGKRLY